MNTKILIQQCKHELCDGWKPFELIWLFIFVALQISAYIQEPTSWLDMIAGISGIICVILVSKGKISNYFFGLIFAYSYFYVAWKANFLGEMNTVLYIYLPSQFIGYFLWKANMQNTNNSETVIAKKLSPKGWLILLASLIIATLIFIEILQAYGGSSTGLDGLSTMIVVAAQLLMILRYREQWILWIVLNIVSIALWAENTAMYLMYSAYLLNSIYGYYNWSRLQHKPQISNIT